LAFLLALAAVPRWAALWRSGYTPDEEITIFAVRGIASTGLPRLPSGVLYDRGLLFSYAAWASGRLFGDVLPSYRLPSLAAGVAVIVLTAVVATRLGGSPLVAGLLATTAPWLVAASTWARFYILFVAAFLATTLTLLDPLTEDSRRGRWFLTGLIATRLLHEMAVSLVALPLFLFLQSRPASRERGWSRVLLLQSVAALAGVQLALVALKPAGAAFGAPVLIATAAGAPAVVPALLSLSSATGLALLGVGALGLGLLLRPLGGSWSCCAIAVACSATLNVGVLAILTAALMLARPDRARRTAAAGVAVALATVALGPCTPRSTAASSAGACLVMAAPGWCFLSGLAAMADRWPLATWGPCGLVAGWRVLKSLDSALSWRRSCSSARSASASLYFLPPRCFSRWSRSSRQSGNAFPQRDGYRTWRRRGSPCCCSALFWWSTVVEVGIGCSSPELRSVFRACGPRPMSGGPRSWATGPPMARSSATTTSAVSSSGDTQPTGGWARRLRQPSTDSRRRVAKRLHGRRILVGDRQQALASEDLRDAWVIVLDTVKYSITPGIATSDVGQGLEQVCDAGGLLVLRPPHADRLGSGLAKETVPCSTD
jgi:hypothetical protein